MNRMRFLLYGRAWSVFTSPSSPTKGGDHEIVVRGRPDRRPRARNPARSGSQAETIRLPPRHGRLYSRSPPRLKTQAEFFPALAACGHRVRASRLRFPARGSKRDVIRQDRLDQVALDAIAEAPELEALAEYQQTGATLNLNGRAASCGCA